MSWSARCAKRNGTANDSRRRAADYAWRRVHERRAPRGAHVGLPRGARLHPLPGAGAHAQPGRLRRRQRRRRPHVRRRGARREGGRARHPVRRRGRQAARRAARRGRPRALGRLHRERPQVPPSRQPRPAAGGDRQLPGLPHAPGRAHRAAGDLHARQLRDEAPARRAGRHLAAARPGRDHHGRPARGAAVPALPPGRGALHALAARHAARRRRAAAGAAGDGPAARSPSPSGRFDPGPEPAVPEPELLAPEPEAAATSEPDRPDWAPDADDEDRQLGLF